MPELDWERSLPKISWTTARKIVQALSLLLFLVLFIAAPRSHVSGSLTNVYLRLDPLIGIANSIANRALIAGMALAIVTLTLTLIFGKAWCGWFCPMGTLLDLFSLDRWRLRRIPPEGWRTVKYGILIVIIVAALFGNLTLLILDPLTILVRTFTDSFWPLLDRLVTFAETSLYRLPGLREGISSFDKLIRPSLFPLTPGDLRGAWAFGALFLLIVLLNVVTERFWCRYLCPLGGLLGWVSRVSFIRRRVGDGCSGCVICEQDCPTGTINADLGYASDPAECSMCMECLESCPQGATHFPLHLGLAGFQPYDPDRRQVLLSIGAAVAGVGLLSIDPAAERRATDLIRPPGTEEGKLVSSCVRCGQCVRVCPTGGLHPAQARVTIEGMWTPILIPRLGYCDYACNACGESCPVDAIPSLSLEEKRQQVIGQAVIDQDRCLPWAEEQECIVCEEMCPLPEKAIVLEIVEVIRDNGEIFALQRPEVLVDQCIGCGICEYKCPVEGEAAIRVYVPGDERQ